MDAGREGLASLGCSANGFTKLSEPTSPRRLCLLGSDFTTATWSLSEESYILYKILNKTRARPSPHFEEVGENISESETRKRNRILNFTPFVRARPSYDVRRTESRAGRGKHVRLQPQPQ